MTLLIDTKPHQITVETEVEGFGREEVELGSWVTMGLMGVLPIGN